MPTALTNLTSMFNLLDIFILTIQFLNLIFLLFKYVSEDTSGILILLVVTYVQLEPTVMLTKLIPVLPAHLGLVPFRKDLNMCQHVQNQVAKKLLLLNEYLSHSGFLKQFQIDFLDLENRTETKTYSIIIKLKIGL